ncbi:sensor histidine kinase [Novosphingobium sp. KA1]|uniref:sensor histidine kinase n=1 Tax=Novosphingobium sp. (strain KA1) TaxID=164608 RepID=UPI001A8F0307|nr:sensor histidine kinase [Novosphingobium sp. KA1]QSR19597.1 hypothetical protein CA833_20800 [Novosphingobium sp. KA1]
MHELAKFDVVMACRAGERPLFPQIAFGVTCAAIEIFLRILLDIPAANIGAFALVYPTVLIATLFGRLIAGLAAFLVSFGWAWWYVMPVARSFDLNDPSDAVRIMINAASVLVVLLLAEVFRQAVRETANMRDIEIERRRMLLTELEHRTKNNFALVGSLLVLQARGHSDPTIRLAFEQAIGRIHTFSKAYEILSLAQESDGTIAMKPYIHDVASRTSAALFVQNIAVVIDADACLLPQHVAVAIGLFLNEALTNCAKYAFPACKRGNINISFRSWPDGWEVIVNDDGIGSAVGHQDRKAGLGQNLMQAFAQQAQAQYDYQLSSSGCSVSLRSGSST